MAAPGIVVLADDTSWPPEGTPLDCGPRETIVVPSLPEHAVFFGEDAPMSTGPPSPRELIPAPEKPLTRWQFYEQFVDRTEAQCREEAAAEQRSIKWKRGRAFCENASSAAAAIGVHSSSSSTPASVVKEKLGLAPKRDCAPFAHGRMFEDHAAAVFKEWFPRAYAGRYTDIEFVTTGLLKSEWAPWIAASPDMLVRYKDDAGRLCTDIVECKCPWTARASTSTEHPFSKHAETNAFPANIKPEHGIQLQLTMDVFNHSLPEAYTASRAPYCATRGWLVAWTPLHTWITNVPLDSWYLQEWRDELEDHFDEQLLPALTKAYNAGKLSW